MTNELGPVGPIDAVSNIVVATMVSEPDGEPGFFDMGRVVAYDKDPTYLIERADGTRFSWRMSWCRHPTQEELMKFAVKLMTQPVHPHTTGGTK